MNSKERMLCALEKGKPDRMPVSLHQWQPYHAVLFGVIRLAVGSTQPA